MKPRALDLFCKAGGASEGLALAGFEVVGVDIEPQPNYPFEFRNLDALKLGPAFLATFDFIWASPPCQGFTAYKRRKGHVKPRENLIPSVRKMLRKSAEETNQGYCIENVVGAPLFNPVMLCGSMFGLDVQRHRMFETNFRLRVPECRHNIWKPRFPPATNRTNLRKTVEVGVYRIPLEVQKKAMGISRKISLTELSNAIPPAYSKHIAEIFMEERYL